MFVTANHIDVNSGQDRSRFWKGQEYCSAIICDGIGSFRDSGEVAELITDRSAVNAYRHIVEILNDSEVKRAKQSGLAGGTTVLLATATSEGKMVRVECLGNGGVLHCHGNFAVSEQTDIPYRYSNLFVPHTTPSGDLYKHISQNADREAWRESSITLKTNNPNGDIIILYSDGISSLEEQLVIQDSKQRFWRLESANLIYILSELHLFLQHVSPSDIQNHLEDFGKRVLKSLKEKDKLEDDAALAIMITDRVLTYYNNRE